MSLTVYHIALVCHIIGITIMAGTTFIDFISFRLFCASLRTAPAKALFMEDYLYKLQRFMGIGMLLIILSGLTMMVKLHAVWGPQTWFRIKMGVLLLIIINGLGLRRSLGTKLRKAMNGKNAAASPGLIRNFNIVQVVQMLLFVLVYTLSIFKFN